MEEMSVPMMALPRSASRRSRRKVAGRWTVWSIASVAGSTTFSLTLTRPWCKRRNYCQDRGRPGAG